MKPFTSIALLGLSTVVNAFYPYHFTEPSPILVPSRIQHRNAHTHSPTLSFPIRRVAIKRATQPIVEADQPSTVNSAGVDQDGYDYSYMIEVLFGPNKKLLHLLLDTAAVNTWAMSSDCKSDTCLSHVVYGSADSSNLKFPGKSFSIAYGSGNVAGTVATDDVTVLGKTFPLIFGLASNVSNDFSSYTMDGIAGFGRVTKVSNNPTGVGAPTLMDTLVSQGVINANLFGLRLSRAGDGLKNGMINFGAPDTSAFSGDINYISTTTNSRGFWEIPLDGVKYDGKDAAIQSGVTTIIDSGTSFMMLPLSDAQAIHKLIAGSVNDGETFSIPCSTNKVLSLTFGGKSYTISPKDYVGELLSGTTCSSNIVGRTTFSSTQWLVGDVFLKNVYSVYDADNNKVGLAPVAGVDSSTASSSKPSSSSRPPLLPGTTMAVNEGKNKTVTGQGNFLPAPSGSLSALVIGLLGLHFFI